MRCKIKRRECHAFESICFAKGVNDDAQILKILSDKLFQTGILPYYLHLLDKVQGASHF